ncbi:hypothetical protein ElyMa_002946000 [Elysia marginata]|uniref:Uncharacterized protein n=1 Tax=Elysia marginata TaxID=1093978 RepID=A0AAV4I612_9GAST|nr:hypothetical protein ElyMa_002946000 [Elysia marginata]
MNEQSNGSMKRRNVPIHADYYGSDDSRYAGKVFLFVTASPLRYSLCPCDCPKSKGQSKSGWLKRLTEESTDESTGLVTQCVQGTHDISQDLSKLLIDVFLDVTLLATGLLTPGQKWVVLSRGHGDKQGQAENGGDNWGKGIVLF